MNERREQVMARAMAAGKFPRSRLAHYRAAYDRDAEGTAALLDRLAGAPILAALHPEEYASDDAYPTVNVSGNRATATPTQGNAREHVNVVDVEYPPEFLTHDERERIDAATRGERQRRITVGKD